MQGRAHLPLRLARRVMGMTALNHLVRLEPVLALVEELDGGTLLDVGSGSTGLSPWLGDAWSATAVDTSFDDYGAAHGFAGRGRALVGDVRELPFPDRSFDDYGAAHGFAGRGRAVVGDVRELPFPDRSFDAVVALDLLEHVPPADRPRALSELRRVTRRRLIVGCPTGEPALEADRRLASRLRRVPDWLVEHLENGFPAREELESELGPHGRLRLIPNEALSSHSRLVRAELSIPGFLIGRLTAIPLSRALRAEGRPRALAGRVLTRVRGDDRPPAYRTVAVLDVG